MARIYDWEAHLTDQERIALTTYEMNMAPAYDTIKVYQQAKDTIRRKAVMRARNAALKAVRNKEKTT